MQIYFQERKTQAQQAEFMDWLKAVLSDETHRAILRTLLDQHELPVIEVGRLKTARHLLNN